MLLGLDNHTHSAHCSVSDHNSGSSVQRLHEADWDRERHESRILACRSTSVHEHIDSLNLWQSDSTVWISSVCSVVASRNHAFRLIDSRREYAWRCQRVDHNRLSSLRNVDRWWHANLSRQHHSDNSHNQLLHNSSRWPNKAWSDELDHHVESNSVLQLQGRA